MALTGHDAYRQIRTQNVAAATSGGAAAASSAFSAQTYWIRLTAVGVLGATNDGIRYSVGGGNGTQALNTANSTSALLPLNWVETVRVTPGQNISVVSNNTSTGNMNVVELSD
jgi:hypothetical protein